MSGSDAGNMSSDASSPSTYGDTSGFNGANAPGIGDFINNLINTYWTQPQQAVGQGIGSLFGITPGQATPQPNAVGAPQTNTLQALLAILGPALAQRAQINQQQQRQAGGIGGGGAGAVGQGGQVITAAPQIQGAMP